MSFQLRRNEALGEGLRRICRKQIEQALAIAHGEEPKSDTPVHHTRKHLKKARAMLRIVQKEIGRGLFQQQDHWLRDVGRLISEIRDAEVRLQTVRQLQGLKHRRGDVTFGELERMLMLELENFVAAFAGWQAQAVPLLEQAAAAVDCWPIEQFSGKQLRCAIQKTYKCGRNRMAHARKNPSTEIFHKLRSEASSSGINCAFCVR